MSLFGRKSKKDEKVQPEPETPQEEARIKPELAQDRDEPSPKKDPKFEKQMALLKELHSEYGLFTSDRFANEDLMLNLTFGILAEQKNIVWELKKLNKLIEDQTKDEAD